MLIQMPIFIILFQVLRWKIGDYATDQLGVTFYHIIPNLTQTLGDAWNVGAVYAIPYIVLLVLFIGFSIAPMILQLKNADQNKNQTMMMVGVMGIMFIWMAFISPAGVMLYWALSSCFGFFQQLIQNRVMEKEDAATDEEIHVQPVRVNVQRRTKKKRQHKSR